ncbi:hypothetical protein [Candidatus Nitrotoga sp. BS]|uniref:hypothetical protein n=1 Tax=Candidatus Nitrotoga sp. BS TaxID=2890408 RepID=UPI001EF1F84A|nr:hypothetical protein [Candidatus Nitrotoga sp. BS]
MLKNITWRIIVLSLVTMLEACMYLPLSTQVFDPDCQVVANHMVLQEVQIAAVHQCANQGCLALVVGAGAVTAASVIISGTIVIAGNIAYWFERRAQCQTP